MTDFSLQEVSALYTSLSQAALELEQAQDEAKQKQQVYDRLTKDLADMLTSIGLTEMKMADGKMVKLKTDYFCSAAQDRMEDILSYLAHTGQSGLAKPKKLGISESDIGLLPASLLDKVQYEINTNTLKSHVRELAENGQLTEQVRTLFAVHQVNSVVLK